MSEWLKIMMEEIARRRAEREAARLEAQRRTAERGEPAGTKPVARRSRP